VHAITEAVTGVIGDYGLYAVFLLMFVDAIFPAASELVMVYAGAIAVGAFPGSDVTIFGREIESTGWAYVAIALAGTVGYTLGSVAGWAIGRYGGRPYLERHGRWLHVTPEGLDRADRWFERYGDVTVFVTRMLPVVRSFVSIPAGIGEMPIVRYTVLTFLGTIPWCFGLAAVGLAVGSQWEEFHDDFRYADYAIVALLVAGVGLLAYRTHRRRARRRAMEERSAEGTGR
jgi:membrane protein DedA with SNARE-associated domain